MCIMASSQAQVQIPTKSTTWSKILTLGFIKMGLSVKDNELALSPNEERIQ